MPIYFFKVEQYNVVEAKEMDGDENAPQTLINVDKDGNGNLVFHAPDIARAKIYSEGHLRIHKNWDDPELLS
jgi:hypothetical protein